MLLAFGGGAILNLMPCVFPILSLGCRGLPTAASTSDICTNWVYAAGVVASFVLVAALLIALQQVSGRAVGWGSAAITGFRHRPGLPVRGHGPV